ncbi:MAG: RhuM family protein [Myxococcaceae bacterium]
MGYHALERVPGEGLHHGRRAAQESARSGSARDYFDELLERIREIRASERRFYQKILDIYATSVDYKSDAELSQRFFATVQNKMHWATHGHTAAEIVHARADATKPFMGMQSARPGGTVRKEDAAIPRTRPRRGPSGEYARYHALLDAKPRAIDAEFERVAKQLKKPALPKGPKGKKGKKR